MTKPGKRPEKSPAAVAAKPKGKVEAEAPTFIWEDGNIVNEFDDRDSARFLAASLLSYRDNIIAVGVLCGGMAFPVITRTPGRGTKRDYMAYTDKDKTSYEIVVMKPDDDGAMRVKYRKELTYEESEEAVEAIDNQLETDDRGVVRVDKFTNDENGRGLATVIQALLEATGRS